MEDSDLETSIECSKKFYTLPLDVTADSLIDSAPFDSSSDPELDNEAEGHGQNQENEGQVKGRGKDSFSMASYMLSFHQPSEHSLQAGDSATVGPTPLSTQIRNNIISAYSESADDSTSGLIGHLTKVLGTQEETIKKLGYTLELTMKEKEECELESESLTKEVDFLRTALKVAMEERNSSPPTTDLTSFMTLPDETHDPVPNTLFKPIATLCQEVQTEGIDPSTNHTSVQASSSMTDCSTQYFNLGFMADMSSQADYHDLVDTSSQAVPKLMDTSTQVLPSVANTSAQAGTGLATVETAAQTNSVSTTEFGVQMNPATFDISLQTQTPSLDLGDVQEKCRQFQSTIVALRKELGSVKAVVGSADPSQVKEIMRNVQALYEEQAAEMSRLKRHYSRDLDFQNQTQIQLRVDLEALRHQKEEISRTAAEEVLALKIKVEQLDDSRKSAERRLVSFSSRLSPEGSELDVGMSLTDSNTHNGPMDHSHMSRTKMEYLTLTPPGCIDDGDVLEGRASSEVPLSVVEDLRLQLSVLEKKYEVNRRYLEEQTAERELERDEFHRLMEASQNKLEEVRRDKERLDEVMMNQKLEMDDYDIRLKEALDSEQELLAKSDKVDEELKSAVDKIYELREIIRDLEEQIDSTTVNVGELKEQNQFLTEALERAEALQKEQLEEALNRSDDTYVTANSDLTEELFTQVHDLAARLEAKLNELDNFKWSSRPASSCSGAISVSTEDVSVREMSFFSKGKDREVTAVDLAEGLRRLDTHFESFIRFEEVIMKKLRDTEMRLEQTRKRQEELENEKLGGQEKMKEQILKISDLESRLDQVRFEPSPNAVTLSGLRARVKVLTEDLEVHKGQLQLKTMEVQDMSEKQAATQALLQKYTSAPKRESTQVKRSSVSIQTERLQSEPVAPKTKRTEERGVQTLLQVLDTGADYMTHPHEALDISSIPGAQGPIHSTPNEGILQRSSKRGFRSWVDGDFERHLTSPEVLRHTQYSRPDRLSTVPELNRTLCSDDEQHRDVQERQIEEDGGVGDDGLTGFVEVDDPDEVLGNPLLDTGKSNPNSSLNLGEADPSTAVLDQTRTLTPPNESSIDFDKSADSAGPNSSNPSAIPSTIDGGLGSSLNKTSDEAPSSTSSTVNNVGSSVGGSVGVSKGPSGIPSVAPSVIPSQRPSAAPSVAPSGSPSAYTGLHGPESKVPFGISQSQTALPSQMPNKARSPCIPTDCNQAELLSQIQQLREDKIRLEAKLEATIESFQRQAVCAPSAPPPPPQPPQDSKLPPPSSPSGPPSPGGPPNTDCVVTSPEQGALLEQVKLLTQQRDELERRLDQGQGQGEAAQCDTERRIKEASSLVTKLEREKRDLEFKLRTLESSNEQRGRQLEEFVGRMSEERNSLQCEIQRISKELQDEIQKRNALQTKFNSALQCLDRQKEADLSTRRENESLKADLEMLNNRFQTFTAQSRTSQCSNANNRTTSLPPGQAYYTPPPAGPGDQSSCMPGRRSNGPGPVQVFDGLMGPQVVNCPVPNQFRQGQVTPPGPPLNASLNYDQFAQSCGRPNMYSTPKR